MTPFDMYNGTSILDELERERQRRAAEESARQLQGIRPQFQAELQRVAANNPPVDLGPAMAQPARTRGLSPDQNQILQQHQANLDAIASMKRGEMPPRLAQKLQEIRAARGSNPTPNPLLDAIGAASGYRRGYGNGYAYGFGGGGGFNPSSMSSEAQAALQRHGVIPPTTAPEEKPQSLLLQAIADLKPFGTTKQKMELAAQAAKGNSNVTVDIDPTTGRAYVIGKGSNNPDRIAMSALERRMNPVGKGMNPADRAANLAMMKAKLQSKRDEAAKKMAGGDLNELLAKGAKAGTKLAAGVAAVQQAKQLKQAATGNKNASLTPKEANAAFISGQDEWTANKEAERQKNIADAAAKAQKDMADARIKAEKEIAQADRDSRASEGELNRKNDVTLAKEKNKGFQSERYANALAQEKAAFKEENGYYPESPEEQALVASRARQYVSDQGTGGSPKVVQGSSQSTPSPKRSASFLERNAPPAVTEMIANSPSRDALRNKLISAGYAEGSLIYNTAMQAYSQNETPAQKAEAQKQIAIRNWIGDQTSSGPPPAGITQIEPVKAQGGIIDKYIDLSKNIPGSPAFAANVIGQLMEKSNLNNSKLNPANWIPDYSPW